MNILMISNYVPFSWEGGNSRFTYLLDMIDTKSNKLELITSNFRHEKKEHRTIDEKQLKKSKYKITLLNEPGYKKNVSLKRFYSHYILSKNLKKYLKTIEKPDVIYCAIPSLDLAKEAAKYAKQNNIKFIIDVQDLWPEAFQMVFNIPIISSLIFTPFRLIANYIYKSADEIIAVSETYANRAATVNKKYKNKLSVFLGTDLKKFDSIEKKEKNNKKITLVYVGTLGHSYNLNDTIKAIKILNDKGYNNIEFKILGNGPLMKEFEQNANSLQINATFLGRLPYNEMVKEMCQCDIAINPIMKGAAQSIINKVGDYAAAGLPVISTQECQEYRELIESRNIGLNCDNDPKDIAKKLEILIKNKKTREEMGKNNRKLAEEKFDRKQTYKEIIKLMF